MRSKWTELDISLMLELGLSSSSLTLTTDTTDATHKTHKTERLLPSTETERGARAHGTNCRLRVGY